MIPSDACEEFDGIYMDLKAAIIGCSLDYDCISIVDDGCDGHHPFHLCRRHAPRSGENGSRCIERLKKQGFVARCPGDPSKNVASWRCAPEACEKDMALCIGCFARRSKKKENEIMKSLVYAKICKHY